MTKSSETKRIKRKIREWDEILSPFSSKFAGLQREIRIVIKMIKEYMMYHPKPKNKTDRIWHEVGWWFFLVMIFFAFKGISYTLFGR